MREWHNGAIPIQIRECTLPKMNFEPGLDVHGPEPLSDGYFRQDVHAADLRCYSELRAFFDADDRSLATDPALFPRGELGRKD